MTCRDKLKMEHPSAINPDCGGGCVGCPHDYEYLPREMGLCHDISFELDGRCTKCWDQEIPEEKPDRNIHVQSGDRTEFETADELPEGYSFAILEGPNNRLEQFESIGMEPDELRKAAELYWRIKEVME